MANVQKITLYDSNEAAQRKSNLSGWVSSTGHFWGENEHMARYDGCTHKRCAQCGEIYAINSSCMPCRKGEKEAAFDALPVEKWNGSSPLILFDTDRYFFNDEVLDFIADQPEGAVLRIAKCEPHYLAVVTEDNWQDDLPEDGELPDDVAEKLEELNALIRASGPISWFEDKVAIDVADLRARVAKRPKFVQMYGRGKRSKDGLEAPHSQSPEKT